MKKNYKESQKKIERIKYCLLKQEDNHITLHIQDYNIQSSWNL